MVPLVLVAALLSAAPQTALFSPGEFKGKKILIASYYMDVPELPLSHVPGILREMGFEVTVRSSRAPLPPLAGFDQLWVISGGTPSEFGAEDVAAVKAFLARGKGVYVLADNTPYTTEANTIAKGLHGIHMEGDYTGMKMVSVLSQAQVKKLLDDAMAKQDMKKLVEYRRAGFFNGTFYAEDHELLTGIREIYEGGTICHPDPSPDLQVILSASNNMPLVAVSKKDSQRMLYDCGWTRLYHEWESHADTSTRWYQNVAAYLMGKRRADLATETPKPKS